jgi:hypothetical protein
LKTCATKGKNSSAPKGAATYQPPATPGGSNQKLSSALKGRNNTFGFFKNAKVFPWKCSCYALSGLVVGLIALPPAMPGADMLRPFGAKNWLD